jgi:group II intron reverse transcriptase/maturase
MNKQQNISPLEKEQRDKMTTGKIEILIRAKKLENFTSRNTNTSHKNYKIHYLLHDPFTFVNAYAKVSKNKGALTKGVSTDSELMSYFGLTNAENIAKKFKTNCYEWSPTRRVWIPKPGKNKKRPIDTPTQEDRIVQEAIRGILEAIYEPEFVEFEKNNKYLATNYGFRPNKSCFQALQTLKLQGQTSNYVLEGDIVGAYNNVNHDILLNILSRRIKDKKFLQVIKSMLKSGIMDDNKYEHNLTGTPQGGIVSPILFNIYMFEFDKFVYKTIIEPRVICEDSPKRRNSQYKKLQYELKKYLELWRKSVKGSDEEKLYKQLFKEKQNQKFITPSYDISTLPKKSVYVRYADDWVLMFTGSQATTIEYKTLIKEFLDFQLKLKLDTEKTIITKTIDGFQFLGYSLKMWSKDQNKKIRTITKNEQGTFRTLRRTTSRKLTLRPDKQRVLKNLKLCKFCDSNFYPIGIRSWSSFDEYDIVLKYRQIMIGIFNYYRDCENNYLLNRVNYILRYSCAKTIATRRKMTMSQVFKMYTTLLKVEKQIYTTDSVVTKYVTFPDITTLKSKPPQKRFRSRELVDPFKIQQFWRTKFKIYNECCICGETNNIALHHMNSLRSIKPQKREKYAYIRSQLNRIQIPVCKICHLDITNGKYDKKKPIDFYNEFIAKL